MNWLGPGSLATVACATSIVASCQGPTNRGSRAEEEWAADRAQMVGEQLAAPDRDIRDPAVLRAMGKVPRHRFVPKEVAGAAYDDCPLPIGYGQTISQPYVVAFMTEQLGLQPHDRVLEIGTGSGYQAAILAEIVAEVFPGCQLTFGPPSPDNRSYRVSFEKIRKHLPGFACAWDARRGAKQLYDLFQRIDMLPEVFQHRTFTRLKQIEYLIRTRQIDDHFFWTEPEQDIKS
jgi:hypothetical protein